MNHPSLQKTHALAAAVAIAVVGASAIVGSLGNWDACPAPFVWRDVALVFFLAALPLAATIAAVLRGLRWSRHVAAVAALEIVVLVAVPQLYIRARCASDAARLAGLIEQSRLGEARALVNRLLMLAPNARWKGRPLRPAAAEVAAAVRELERRVATPLDTNATDDDRLRRARDLAMLGRTSGAIAVLDSSPSLAALPDADNLRGTIHETRGEWKAARQWYDRARLGWQEIADSPARTAGLVRATTGVAYCERKLGRLPQAEATYQEVLALAPTAESHFLLAQFYEDTQQSAKAQAHARQAMTLDPERYQADGQKLIDKLVTLHFGCWGVFNNQAHP